MVSITISHAHPHNDGDVIISPAGNCLRGGETVPLTHVGLCVVEAVGIPRGHTLAGGRGREGGREGGERKGRERGRRMVLEGYFTP